MTIKCIRCGNIEESAAKYIGVWIIKYGVNGTLYDNEHFVVGLCPDCQLPSEVVGCKDNLQNEGPLPIPDGETRSYAQWLDNIDDRMKFLERCRKEHYNMLQQHEMDLLDIGARLLNVEEGMSEKAYTNLLGCLTTIEKRTAKLEREMDRVWEVIRCKGEK